jgi:hypothetical protein
MPMINFEEFKNNCCQEIKALQDEFLKVYDINSYEHWFYDDAIGVFHFKSDDGRDLYFNYVNVGSYSTKTNTWMWAWNNNTTVKQVTTGLEKVKAFGEANRYNDLNEGLLNGDEFTGWELTSVTAKLLSAIGTYRVPHEHLFIYFVFTNEITQEQYDALKAKYIACDIHGTSRMAFVCQHLITASHRGFHEAFESNPLIEPEEDYQAWCDECEKVREQEGEWNDTSMAFANIKVVCDQCYFEIKKRNVKHC